MPRDKDTTPVCLIPDCGGLHYSRGLCATCYKTAITWIHKDRTTWEQLIAKGLALEIGARRKQKDTPLSRAFRAAFSETGPQETDPQDKETPRVP